MDKLTEKKVFCISNKVKYRSHGLPKGDFKNIDINPYLDFAYNMSFGNRGQHRANRSGGKNSRNNLEIFINALTGKLGELAVYKTFQKTGLELQEPDTQLMPTGKWDDYDFQFKHWMFSVKTSSHFSQLLLLEKKDFNENGTYLPNNKIYHAHILVRIKPDLKFTFNHIKNYSSVSLADLSKVLEEENINFDIPGYLNTDGLKNLIRNGFEIKQGEFLNCTTQMDADNYYIQAGDLAPLEKMTTYLKKEEKK